MSDKTINYENSNFFPLSNKLKKHFGYRGSSKYRRHSPSTTYQLPSTKSGFTIVELLVVIVVIGILAAITIVSYAGISQRATVASLQTDLTNASQQLKLYYTDHGSYPTGLDANNCPTGSVLPSPDTKYCLKASPGNTFTTYTSTSTTFGLVETNTNGMVYNVTDSTGPTVGAIPSPYIQTITAANCPLTRTQVQDARDGHTYWVQKLADGKCWMLTNLGYVGGGTNTYSDTKTLANGTGGSVTYTAAQYYVTPSTTNFTTEPTAPSTSTDGTGQYGYLYNFCGANGGQTGNGACSSTDSTAVNTTISICPSGWRLPTGGGGEFGALNTAINGGSTTTDAGLIGTPWLAQRGGDWNSGFSDQGSYGNYWSSTQNSATNAYNLFFAKALVSQFDYNNKNYGYAVRCIAV
jgi:general secretion pathway protein G